MANDEIKFLPIFQILDIKNIWFLLELKMALATAIKKKFEPVCMKLDLILTSFFCKNPMFNPRPKFWEETY